MNDGHDRRHRRRKWLITIVYTDSQETHMSNIRSFKSMCEKVSRTLPSILSASHASGKTAVAADMAIYMYLSRLCLLSEHRRSVAHKETLQITTQAVATIKPNIPTRQHTPNKPKKLHDQTTRTHLLSNSSLSTIKHSHHICAPRQLNRPS